MKQIVLVSHLEYFLKKQKKNALQIFTHLEKLKHQNVRQY